MPLVREDSDLVSYGPHELLDRRERARFTSCAPFGSSKPAITLVSILNHKS